MSILYTMQYKLLRQRIFELRKGAIRMRKIKFGLFALCISLYNIAYSEGTLVVNNNLPDIEVRITTDLLCGDPLMLSKNVRYTTPLDENPILYNKGHVKAHWSHCQILSQDYFKKLQLSDHSKIYITLLDTKTGDQFIATVHANCRSSREIHFSNNHISLNMGYSHCNMFPLDVTLTLDPLTNKM
jgi:hypothetical protein